MPATRDMWGLLPGNECIFKSPTQAYSLFINQLTIAFPNHCRWLATGRTRERKEAGPVASCIWHAQPGPHLEVQPEQMSVDVEAEFDESSVNEKPPKTYRPYLRLAKRGYGQIGTVDTFRFPDFPRNWIVFELAAVANRKLGMCRRSYRTNANSWRPCLLLLKGAEEGVHFAQHVSFV